MRRKEERRRLKAGDFLEIGTKEEAIKALKEIHAYMGVKWGGDMPLNEKQFDIRDDKYPIYLFIEDGGLYWAEGKDVTDKQLKSSFKYKMEE